MQEIKLTEEHESKLLEMCKVLFPKYTTIKFGDLVNYYLERNEILTLYNEKEGIDIHWFEFCMTHLVVKLSDEFTKYNLCEADYTSTQYPHWFGQEIINNLNPFIDKELKKEYEFIHPVDYLYEQFKKLK